MIYTGYGTYSSSGEKVSQNHKIWSVAEHTHLERIKNQEKRLFIFRKLNWIYADWIKWEKIWIENTRCKSWKHCPVIIIFHDFSFKLKPLVRTPLIHRDFRRDGLFSFRFKTFHFIYMGREGCGGGGVGVCVSLDSNYTNDNAVSLANPGPS